METRSDDERLIFGRAIVFDSLSNNLGFYEKINRGAITQELIDSSDIVFTFNHDTDKILARRKNGKGTLNIELREDGVYFSFYAPNTTLGNDMLEYVKRGDISTCSFAFTVSNEEGSQKWEKKDGVMYREIMKIDGLYDLSAVTHEAYSDTSINARSLEIKEEAEKLIDEEERSEETLNEEETSVKEETEETEERNLEEKPADEPKDEETDESIPEEIRSGEEPENKEEDKPEEEIEKRDINRKNNINIMKKTLVKELRNALDNNIKSFKFNAETRTVAVGPSGQDGAVPGVHDDVVETEIQGILEPLYANSVLTQLGVKWYSGLPQGDVQIPIMGKSNVGWAGELGAATETGNSFTSKKLTPKRLTAFVDISKQLIYQDTIGVENAIRRDIVNALNDQLEATILGAAAGTTDKPAGIFNGQTVTKNETFAKVCTAEAGVESANVYGQMKYLMSPSAKAFYRSLIKGTNATGMVYENNEMDGTSAIVTSNVPAGQYVYGDFSNLAIGSWGDIDITVDEYTQAVNGCVRLVINAYFDAAVLRPEAFAFGKIA